MSLVLKQVRTCDGACCIESPRFHNEDHSDCIYRDASKPEKGCMLMAGTAELPKGDLSAKVFFQKTCVDWPEHGVKRIGQTSNCCQQWVENGIS